MASGSRRGRYFGAFLEPATWIAARQGIVDGEVIALDDAGEPDFARLQARIKDRVGLQAGAEPVVFVLEGAAATHRDEPGIPDLGEDHRSAHSRLHRRSPEPINSLLGWG